MKIEQVKAKTSKSNEMLQLARELAEEAAQLPEGSDERKWMEERAQKLVDEARVLTDTAKQAITKYR